MKKLYLVVIIILGCVVGFYWLYSAYFLAGQINVLSVSSDGKYAISADEKEWVVLWNLEKKTKKILSRKAHVWIAYFIPYTNDFLWQDQQKFIHIQTVGAKQETIFPSKFFIDGIAMTSDKNRWMAGSIEGNPYYCRGQDDCKIFCYLETPRPKLPEANCGETPDVYSADKPYNFSMTPDGRYAIGVDFSIFLWDLETGSIIHRYKGNIGKTFATLSPDGKYIVGGDEQTNAFVWETHSRTALFTLYDLVFGKDLTLPKETHSKWDSSVLHVKKPDDFGYKTVSEAAVMSVKFIDKTHYLLFIKRAYQLSNNDHAYAVLYDLLDPSPLKYLSLGKSPKPALQYFQRDQAIDTSWQAHILVMAKENEGGILVYRYDPEKQTLTKIWDAK